MNIHVNSDAAPVVNCVGEEGVKIIVIDDFLVDLQSIKACACESKIFQPDGKTAYPGVRAELPSEYVDAVLSIVKPIIFDAYDVPRQLNAQVEMNYYSLLTLRESELQPHQRTPHFDTNKKYFYAILHYLNEGNFGGTGFFRHRPTRFECISQDRREIYLQSVNTFMASKGLPEQQYINKTTNHYELFADVPYKPNRLAIYPGCILHSGLVSNADVSDNPALGRLTANIFVDCI